MMGILLTGAATLGILLLVIMICVMLFDMVKTVISLVKDSKTAKKNKKDEDTSEREELLKADEKMYSIINRARATLTEEEKSHILNYVKEAHSCNSISCFWLNKLSYITVFEGNKAFPLFCIGVLVEKIEGKSTIVNKNRTFIKNDCSTNPYIVSFVSYDFKEEFSGRSTLPLRLEEYVVTQDKYEQIMNNFVFRNSDEYIHLGSQGGDCILYNCILYNSDLITIVSTKGVDDVH